MSEGKTPTIEQKSTFTSKTKEGSDVEFEAIIKFYINPAGDVRINAPGSSSVEEREFLDTRIGARPIPDESSRRDVKEEKPEHREPIETQLHSAKDKDEPSKQKEVGTDKQKEVGTVKQKEEKHHDGKFQSNKEIDKQVPRIQGDCPISQFIPDPCKAVDDLTKSIKEFFSGSSCPPCPNETSNFVPTPKPKQLVGGELEHGKNQAGNEVMEKEVKYEV